MLAIRRLLSQRYLAALICAAALLLKLLVPTGYMIGNEHDGRVTIELCSGVAPQPMAMEMPELHGGVTGHGKSKDHGKVEMPCAFSALSASTLAAVDPLLLALAIAFIIAAASDISPPALASPPYLRPPLRGPPAAA